VSDLVEGIVRLLEVESPDDEVHEPVNLGNPMEFTVGELAQEVLRMTGSASEVRYLPLPVDDPKVRRPIIERARRLLNWQPVVPLVEGLERTIAYFREEIKNSE
jgi:UDP-glucuronate decarboxylase